MPEQGVSEGGFGPSAVLRFHHRGRDVPPDGIGAALIVDEMPEASGPVSLQPAVGLSQADGACAGNQQEAVLLPEGPVQRRVRIAADGDRAAEAAASKTIPQKGGSCRIVVPRGTDADSSAVRGDIAVFQ